jgi:hypothetical protein
MPTGQIKRLSEKQSLGHVITFKRAALDTIANDQPEGFDPEIQGILRARIAIMINGIDRAGHPWYNQTWKDEWISLNPLDSSWFKLLWTKKQLQTLKAINKEVIGNNLFKSKKSKLPSAAMLKLKIKFEGLTEHPVSDKG